MRDDDVRAIRPWLVGTDLGMLAYWALTSAQALGWVDVPSAWLFSDYTNPAVTAWNWSFLPLDVVFAVCGLVAAALYRRQHAGWRVLMPVSLVLTWCAGCMAISFWAVRCEFDPVWWAMNLFLMVWPMAFLPRLWRGAVALAAHGEPR